MGKLKYIIQTIVETVRLDITSSYQSLDKPKELVNFFFWLTIILFITQKILYAEISFLLLLCCYVYKIIRQGKWKHKMREDYPKA